MKSLSKNGQAIQYARTYSLLIDYVDEQERTDVTWTQRKDRKETKVNGNIYCIRVVSSKIKPTISAKPKKKCWHCNRNTIANESKMRCTVCTFEYQKFQSREEYLSYIIDSLLLIDNEYKNDYSLTEKAIEIVAVSIRNNPNNYPVTMSLYNHMKEKELL